MVRPQLGLFNVICLQDEKSKSRDRDCQSISPQPATGVQHGDAGLATHAFAFGPAENET